MIVPLSSLGCPLAYCIPQSTFSKPPSWESGAAGFALSLASTLTDPFCSMHEYYRQIIIVDDLHPKATKLENFVRKMFFGAGALACLAIAPLPTLGGIVLRWITSALQQKPFLHFQSKIPVKQLTSSPLTLFSWNICAVPGGYSITDGGVLPWSYRINEVNGHILKQQADIVTLYEVFDIKTADRLIRGLEHAYTHFYYNIGPLAKGPGSALFVASKVEIINPDFIPFGADALDGRTKNCNKGVFAFDIVQSENLLKEGLTTTIRKIVATIATTHLQHSEIPDKPTAGELKARELEMEIIHKKFNQIEDKNRTLILTGDLNMNRKELDGLVGEFDEGQIVGRGTTWGGDTFMASKMGKNPSKAETIDFTLVTNGSIETDYIPTGYDATVFEKAALSDHQGLMSKIKLLVNDKLHIEI